MGLRIGLLGPLEIRSPAGVLAGPVGKQRSVFAMLLLAPGRTITRAAIIEELWDETPPASANANVRTYVSGLRSWLDLCLGKAATERLVGTGRGWSLVLPDSEVDVLAFEAGLAAGRRAAGAGDLPGAEENLRRCVHLFRGAALSDVSQGPALAARAAVLNAQWQAAVEEYVDVLLRLGRHTRCRELLLRFLSTHPGRERAWGQLMLACYRDRDLPGALEAYRNARATLADRFGVEPGAELVALQRAILRREPARLASPAPPRQRVVVRRAARRVGGP